jgi:putative toxin-antitoxin system antitoxin component (TIGR02293 family)
MRMEEIVLAFGDVADVLGLAQRQRLMASPFALITRIEDGLPVAALDRVARLLAPDDAQFKYRLVPKATYERRKLAHKLSADESTRLARVARVWALALDSWQTEGAARGFLFRPHPMIEDKRPIDIVIQSEFGAELVIEILGRLKYGTAA